MAKGIRSRRRSALFALIALLIVGVVVFLLFSKSKTPSSLADGAPLPTYTPTTYSSLGASPSPTGSGTSFTGTLPNGGSQTGSNSGIGGSSFSSGLGSHKVLLRAWADSPLRAYGSWWIPSTHAAGSLTGTLTNWTHSATAYGSSKFGLVYVASDYRGVVVHCSVSVDGVVRASGQSHGPYGYVVCAV